MFYKLHLHKLHRKVKRGFFFTKTILYKAKNEVALALFPYSPCAPLWEKLKGEVISLNKRQVFYSFFFGGRADILFTYVAQKATSYCIIPPFRLLPSPIHVDLSV